MDQMSRRLAIGCLGAFACNASFAEESESAKLPNKTALTAEPFPIVAFRKDQRKLVGIAATRFAKRFGIKGILEQETNPRCCVWFEIVGRANPGSEGWFFVHHAGGSLCYATDEKQLDAAVTALIASADKPENNGQLPIGISTSFPVNPLT